MNASHGQDMDRDISITFLFGILTHFQIRKYVPRTGDGQRYLCHFSWNFNQFQYSVNASHGQDMERGNSVHLFLEFEAIPIEF